MRVSEIHVKQIRVNQGLGEYISPSNVHVLKLPKCAHSSTYPTSIFFYVLSALYVFRPFLQRHPCWPNIYHNLKLIFNGYGLGT